MASRFSVIQYLPDPVTGETINIGVLACSDEKVRLKFLDNWRRVQTFGGEDITFLQEFADRMEAAVSEEMVAKDLIRGVELNEEIIREMTQTWINSIQFTDLRSSTQAPGLLVTSLARRYLKEPTPVKRPRSKSTAARLAAEQIHMVLESQVGEDEADEYLKRNHDVSGEVEEHQFDVVVGNGKAILATEAISFEVKEGKSLNRLIDSTAWKIDDVRKLARSLPLAVSFLPPKDGSQAFDRAHHLFAELDAAWLPEAEVADWVSENLRLSPKQQTAITQE